MVRALIVLLLFPCPAGAAPAVTLHVFAAASLTDAFSDIAKAFESSRPGVTVEFNFAGSQLLRTQIEEGAEADVFVSADRAQADALRSKKMLDAYYIFTRNSLVVVTPLESPRVWSLGDLARPGRKVVIAGPTVPVGRYTTEVLRKMTASGLYGDDYQTRVIANVVSQESNVRQVLAKVVLGEADGGFVYRTDARAAKVRILSIPVRMNVIADYAIGAVNGAHSAEIAAQFVTFVQSAEGQWILRKYGFTN